MTDMKKFFQAKSIAVIGASTREGSIGYGVLKNIIYGEKDAKDKTRGFKGKIYPISPKYDNILGLKTYASILDVPGTVDMAVLIIPGKIVPKVLTECGEKGCKNVIIISAGFAEHGEEGKRREKEITRIAKEQGIRFIGPNCLGIFSPYASLNASFAHAAPQKGPISMISQSGALCTAIIAYAKQEHIGFSNFVSSGNKADIEDTELIEYFSEDPNTKCIAIYLESLRDGRRFYERAKKVAHKKPIIVMKVGKTEAGKKAASSHTGALAGVDWAYEAAFRQSGVYRVQTMYNLFDAPRALGYQPIPEGESIAILTNAGGPGVIASDKAYEIGLPLAELRDDTLKQLDAICPPSWSRGNPVDIIGDADVERYAKSLDILLSAPEVDGVILIVAPQSVADPLVVAKHVAYVQKTAKKPIIACFVGIIGEESEDFLEISGVPTIEFPERAVVAMHALVARRKFLIREAQRAKIEIKMKIETKPNKKCLEIFKKVKEDQRKLLTLNEARTIFELLGIPMSRSCIAKSEDEVAKLSCEVGFPLAMKISSPNIVHKTEAGGVILEIQDEEGAVRAYNKILKNVKNYNPNAKIEGVVIDAMMRGPEVIIGVSSDPQFGPMVMFGLGGTMVEVYKDVSFRLIPLTRIDALEMIEEIKGKAIYQGARGWPVANPDELSELIVKVAEVVRLHPDIKELDINPLIVTKEGLVAVDARILLN